jgi:glyoxylase-like metal-dependent hydrolase (beta-lactamase superfamily II)
LGGLFPSAAYVVETHEGLVLVDSGLEDDAGPLKAQMAQLGLDWRGIRAVLLTHAHGDHCGGAEHLRAATGARVYAGAGDTAVLRAGQPREAFFSNFSMPGYAPHPTTIDVELKGDETIVLGDARIRALATPGHTPGSICYLLERPGVSALFGGDVISMLVGEDDAPVLGRRPLGTYSAYLAPRYRGDAAAYLSTVRLLRSMPVPDLVLPGHPRSDPTPQSPVLSQRRWEEMLDAGIRELETLIARYQADGADFLDGQPKELLPGLYYLGDREGAAVYGLFAGSRFFLFDAPGGPGLLDFVNDRLRQLGRQPAPPTAVLLTSCGTATTSGLAELVEQCRPLIVVSPAGLQELKTSGPPGSNFLSADELSSKDWFEVAPLPLRGRGRAPIAYRLTLSGKTVLVSGRFPIIANPDTTSALFADLIAPGGDPFDYLKSIMALRVPTPDLWLPAFPTDGQNANIYDTMWERIIDSNWDAVEASARQFRKADR